MEGVEIPEKKLYKNKSAMARFLRLRAEADARKAAKALAKAEAKAQAKAEAIK